MSSFLHLAATWSFLRPFGINVKELLKRVTYCNRTPPSFSQLTKDHLIDILLILNVEKPTAAHILTSYLLRAAIMSPSFSNKLLLQLLWWTSCLTSLLILNSELLLQWYDDALSVGLWHDGEYDWHDNTRKQKHQHKKNKITPTRKLINKTIIGDGAADKATLAARSQSERSQTKKQLDPRRREK